jgi:hypothetical protein
MRFLMSAVLAYILADAGMGPGGRLMELLEERQVIMNADEAIDTVIAEPPR